MLTTSGKHSSADVRLACRPRHKKRNRMKAFVIALLFLAPVYGFAMDVFPAKSVLGVPWDSSEEKMKQILGEPNGYFATTKYKKLYFYGKSVVLIFVRGKLKGFRYYDTCCQVLENTAVSINSKYSNEPLSLNGTLLTGKSFEAINKALPQEMGKPDYRAEIATDEAVIRFGFIGKGGYPGQAQAFDFYRLEVDYML